MGTSHSKGKKFERETGKVLLESDGECPQWKSLTSSTGRVGQQTNLQIDVISRSYAGECKYDGAVPIKPFKWFNKLLKIIEEREMDKEPLLALKYNNNALRKSIGGQNPQNRLHCITPERHAELLEKEQKFEEMKEEKNLKWV